MGGGALFLSGYQLGRDAAAASRRHRASPHGKPFWDGLRQHRPALPLGPVDPDDASSRAPSRAWVEAVGDPYSSYLSPDDYTTTLDDISGTFEGIGAEIGSVDSSGNTSDCATYGPECFLVIITPIEGSLAERAGLGQAT